MGMILADSDTMLNAAPSVTTTTTILVYIISIMNRRQQVFVLLVCRYPGCNLHQRHRCQLL